MIVMMGRIKDGEVLPPRFYSVHEHVIVPIFSQGDVKHHLAAWKRGDNTSLVVCGPQTGTTPQKIQEWFGISSAKALPAYLAGLPPRANPLLSGVMTPGGLLIPGELGMKVSGPDSKL